LEFTENILRYQTKRFDFYKPPSWKLQIGADRFINDQLNTVMRFGIGGSWGDKNTLIYALPQITFYPILGEIGVDMTSSIGTWYQNNHFGIDYSKSITNTSPYPSEHISVYWTIQYSNMSLKLSSESDIAKATIVYQF
jgi:hypothetical protein